MSEKDEASLLGHGTAPGYGTISDLEKQAESPRRQSALPQWRRARLLSSAGLDWMSRLDDEIPVSALTIPGTHDSAAYTYSWPFVRTQSLTIQGQLDAGIRYFDIRLGLRNNILELVHGPTYLGLRFDEVLAVIYRFLEAHPTEGIIIQIKRDRKDDRSTIPFSQAVTKSILATSSRWRTENTTPTLGELRGRIQLFRRFEIHTPFAYGINVSQWHDNPEQPFTIHTAHNVQVTVQDHYKLARPAPLPGLIAQKGADVVELLNRAADDPDQWHWYINFTSSFEFNFWYQITPHEVAVGGWYGFRWEYGINIRVRNYLQEYVGKARYGIVAMDFPEVGTEDLIDTIIVTNLERADDARTWRACLWSILSFSMLRNVRRRGTSSVTAYTASLRHRPTERRLCKAAFAATLGFVVLVFLVYILHESVRFCPQRHYTNGFLDIHDC